MDDVGGQNNLRYGEEREDVTLLAVLSLFGLVACWAVLARRQPQAAGLAVAPNGYAGSSSP